MSLTRPGRKEGSHIIKNDNSCCEMMEDFENLGTILTNQNSIQEEIKSRLKSGNACYHSVQNFLSSDLLTKNLTINIQNHNFACLLYGCETWSLTLKKERRLRMFGNRVLRGVFVPKRDEVTGEWRKLHNEELNDLYCSPNIVLVIKLENNEIGVTCSTYGGEEGRIRYFGGET